MGCLCKYFVLGSLCTAILSLLVVVFSATSVLHQVSLVQTNVTDHKVNETLILGTLSYCLTSNTNVTNVTCSPTPSIGYAIENAEVLSQVWWGSMVTKVISVLNPVALLAATFALGLGLFGAVTAAKYLSLFGLLIAVAGGVLVVIIASKSNSGFQGLAAGFFLTVYAEVVLLLVSFCGFLEANFYDMQVEAGPGGEEKGGGGSPPGDEEQAKKDKLLEMLARAHAESEA